MKSLATKREFIPNASPPDCKEQGFTDYIPVRSFLPRTSPPSPNKVNDEQAQTMLMIMLWSSSSSTVDATDEMSVEKINEYINKFKANESNKKSGLTGYPILTTFLVPPTYDKRHDLNKLTEYQSRTCLVDLNKQSKEIV